MGRITQVDSQGNVIESFNSNDIINKTRGGDLQETNKFEIAGNILDIYNYLELIDNHNWGDILKNIAQAKILNSLKIETPAFFVELIMEFAKCRYRAQAYGKCQSEIGIININDNDIEVEVNIKKSNTLPDKVLEEQYVIYDGKEEYYREEKKISEHFCGVVLKKDYIDVLYDSYHQRTDPQIINKSTSSLSFNFSGLEYGEKYYLRSFIGHMMENGNLNNLSSDIIRHGHLFEYVHNNISVNFSQLFSSIKNGDKIQFGFHIDANIKSLKNINGWGIILKDKNGNDIQTYYANKDETTYILDDVLYLNTDLFYKDNESEIFICPFFVYGYYDITYHLKQNKETLKWNSKVATKEAEETAIMHSSAKITGTTEGFLFDEESDIRFGFCYSENNTPDIYSSVADAKIIVKEEPSITPIYSSTLNWEATLNNLKSNTTYYYSLFVSIGSLIYYSDNIESFTTKENQPEAVTIFTTAIEATSVKMLCGYDYFCQWEGACGVEYWKGEDKHMETLFDMSSQDCDKGVYEVSLNSLLPNTTYYYRPFIKVENNYYWASEIDAFTTKCPDENHPHIIDLGLPSGTKWACCNVGATNPEDNGGYYAWGETSEKDYYGITNYKFAYQDKEHGIWNDGFNNYYSIIDIGSNIANTQNDAATFNWGKNWQMPTQEQLQELRKSCFIVWESAIISGLKFIANNGKTIILPAASCQIHNRIELFHPGHGIWGHYWSSTANNNYFNQFAFKLVFWIDDYNYDSDLCNRTDGCSIRPIWVGAGTP